MSTENPKPSPPSLRKRFCYLEPRATQDYGSARAYCDVVSGALADYQESWNIYRQAFSEWQNTLARQSANQAQALAAQQGLPVQHIQVQINRGGAYIQLPNGTRTVTSNYRPASYVKRILAELIDFVIFFCFKLFIVWICIEKLELIDLTEFERLLGKQGDLQGLIDVTQSLVPYEILSKFFITLLEAYCLTFGLFPGFPLGATPGKILTGIRVISANQVMPANGPPGSVTVVGLERVPFKNALLRSFVKNLFINSLLPLSTVAFAFHQNRSVYDLMAKTIVVEAE